MREARMSHGGGRSVNSGSPECSSYLSSKSVNFAEIGRVLGVWAVECRRPLLAPLLRHTRGGGAYMVPGRVGSIQRLSTP